MKEPPSDELPGGYICCLIAEDSKAKPTKRKGRKRKKNLDETRHNTTHTKPLSLQMAWPRPHITDGLPVNSKTLIFSQILSTGGTFLFFFPIAATASTGVSLFLQMTDTRGHQILPLLGSSPHFFCQHLTNPLYHQIPTHQTNPGQGVPRRTAVSLEFLDTRPYYLLTC